MHKFSSLLKLVRSLTRQERKSFSIALASVGENDYRVLYDIINASGSDNADEIKAEFQRRCPGATFNTAVSYLFRRLTQHVASTKNKSDNFYELFQDLLCAKALYEKSLFSDSFALIAKVKETAVRYNNDMALMAAQRLELDFLQATDFNNMKEEELMAKQAQIRATIRRISKLTEHSALYELLRLRILRDGFSRSAEDLHLLDDLVTSEISIMASVSEENFNIQKNHWLFQANYFINAGDYTAAFNSYIELNNLFEENKHMWSSPPIYYLRIIQGLLESLRMIGDHQGMEYFVQKLEALDSGEGLFQLQVLHTAFIYRLASLIDRRLYRQAVDLIANADKTLTDKYTLLSSNQQAEAALYKALAYFGAGENKLARRTLKPIISLASNPTAEPLMRTIRIVNLMILYQMGEEELVQSEANSLKRNIHKVRTQKFATEQLLIKFVTTYAHGVPAHERKRVWATMGPKLQLLRQNKYEKALLAKFDFTYWIESQILGTK